MRTPARLSWISEDLADLPKNTKSNFKSFVRLPFGAFIYHTNPFGNVLASLTSLSAPPVRVSRARSGSLSVCLPIVTRFFGSIFIWLLVGRVSFSGKRTIDRLRKGDGWNSHVAHECFLAPTWHAEVDKPPRFYPPLLDLMGNFSIRNFLYPMSRVWKTPTLC